MRPPPEPIDVPAALRRIERRQRFLALGLFVLLVLVFPQIIGNLGLDIDVGQVAVVFAWLGLGLAGLGLLLLVHWERTRGS